MAVSYTAQWPPTREATFVKSAIGPQPPAYSLTSKASLMMGWDKTTEVRVLP